MKVTLTGMVVNVLLIFLKFAGGIFGSSKAMIADAVHSVSDFITDFGVLVGLRFISKPADSKHPYGHGRLETAISLLMGLFIIITGIGILKNASYSIILSWRNIFPKMPGTIALLTGIISIICKEGLYQYTSSVARKTGSSTLKANAWHHRSDALSSVATVIGIGGAILLGDRWTVLDPLAAVFVSGLVIKIGVEIGWNALRELSDEALSNERQQKLHTVINTVEGVHGCHHLQIPCHMHRNGSHRVWCPPTHTQKDKTWDHRSSRGREQGYGPGHGTQHPSAFHRGLCRGRRAGRPVRPGNVSI